MLSQSPASITPVSLAELPASLIDAAVRVCREIHNDPPEAVAAMLEDLRYYPPASWGWLTEHFRQQLPAITTAVPAITCGNCQHGKSTSHPAILTCAAGVLSCLPIAGRWATDRHDCPKFIDRATVRPVKTDPRPTQTETLNHDPFSFLET